jgi:hypothetical protein
VSSRNDVTVYPRCGSAWLETIDSDRRRFCDNRWMLVPASVYWSVGAESVLHQVRMGGLLERVFREGGLSGLLPGVSGYRDAQAFVVLRLSGDGRADSLGDCA